MEPVTTTIIVVPTIVMGSVAIAAAATLVVGLPKAVNEYQIIFSKLKNHLSNKVTLEIDEFDGYLKNEIYEAAEIYLRHHQSFKNPKIINVSKSAEGKNFIENPLVHNQKMKDFYYGHKFKWVWLKLKCVDHPKQVTAVQTAEMKSFNLTFRKEDEDYVKNTYLPYIMAKAKNLKG
ncbi:hypothetical protein P3L10_008565 [Capsicum annuum]